MRRPRLWTVRRTAASTLLLLLVLASTAAAPTITGPKTGRITGHVRDQAGAPVASVQVFVIGTALHALTDQSGSYTIAEVAEGTVQLRVAAVGYKPVQTSVSVRAGRTTVHDFVLEASPLQMSELTVTDADAASSPTQTSKRRVEEQGKVENRASRVAGSQGVVSALPAEPWRRQPDRGQSLSHCERQSALDLLH